MELLAQKYQPALANDRSVNSQEVGAEGRMDCVDNAANTTTVLRILEDLGTLPGLTVKTPRFRMSTSITRAHWTAVVVDQATEELWSIDSWYRNNGHLPFVVPLADWLRKSLGWEPPFDRLNPYPVQSDELCAATAISTAGYTVTTEVTTLAVKTVTSARVSLPGMSLSPLVRVLLR
jgi:hypothetical protein